MDRAPPTARTDQVAEMTELTNEELLQRVLSNGDEIIRLMARDFHWPQSSGRPVQEDDEQDQDEPCRLK